MDENLSMGSYRFQHKDFLLLIYNAMVFAIVQYMFILKGFMIFCCRSQFFFDTCKMILGLFL